MSTSNSNISREALLRLFSSKTCIKKKVHLNMIEGLKHGFDRPDKGRWGPLIGAAESMKRMLLRLMGRKHAPPGLYEYYETRGVVAASSKYDISPLDVLRRVFKHKYKASFTVLNGELRTDAKVHPRDHEQFKVAISYSYIDDSELYIKAIEYEAYIGTLIRGANVKYKTQSAITQDQIREYGRAIATPDYLIEEGLTINDQVYYWIDAKDYYYWPGTFLDTKIKDQVRRYYERWGKGLLIFSCGYLCDSASEVGVAQMCDFVWVPAQGF